MIDRYLLRYFLAVVDQGGFSKAALACRVSQPTLSVGIAKLERIIGAPLFNRTNRRVEITKVGSRFVGHARQIEAAFGVAEAVGRDRDPTPLIRLGVLSTLPGAWLETAIVQCRDQAPDERLEITEASQKDILSLLARGRIDAAIGIATPDVKPRRHLFSEGYAVAFHTKHRFAQKDAVRAEDLAGETMIVRRHCEALADTSRHFTQRGIRPFMAARTISDEKAMAYVRSGLGLTVMPQCFSADSIAMATLWGFENQRRVAMLLTPDTVRRVEKTAAYAIFGDVYEARGLGRSSGDPGY